jgi:hypothetical protein
MLSFLPLGLLLLSSAFALAAAPTAAEATTYVYSGNLTWQEQFSVRTCSGLINRNVSKPAYIVQNMNDIWLQVLYNVTTPTLTPVTSFLNTCLEIYGGKYILYNAHTQQSLVPELMTLAGVLGAVPFDTSVSKSLPSSATVLAFDGTVSFKDFQPIDATRYVYQHHLNATTGMAKLNPGYAGQGCPGPSCFHPNITRGPSLGLTDYIVYAKLFNTYLTEGCLPFTKENALLKTIVQESSWPKPVRVMGYDNSFVVEGGDFFEAETLCDLNVGMGQVASAGTANLAYYTQKAPRVTSPLPFNPTPATSFNKSKTYIAFVVGDGDNLDYIFGNERRAWIEERLEMCANKQCSYPLLWTMSPHMLYLAPDVVRWYGDQLLQTQTDRFALPPSGDLYSYPELFPEKDQDTHVRNTERDAYLLSTSVTTDWEWASRWNKALESFFPKYATAGIITSLVTVNTPYNIPTFAFGDDLYKVCNTKICMKGAGGDGNKTVVFRPHEWRGTRGSTIPWANEENLNVSAMAAEINGYAPGSVSAVYLTSDGGGNLQDIDALVNVLDEHVEVVGTNIGAMALAADKEKST